MKHSHTALVATVCLAATMTTAVFAIDATPSGSIDDQNVKMLREKIATKVEEMRKKDQRAYAGKILKIDDTSITITAIENNDDKQYLIKIDETLTNMYRIVGATSKEIKKSDLKKDDYVIVTGQQLNEGIEADSIYIDEEFIVRTGSIIEVSKDSFFLKVVTNDKEEYTLDIQNSTRQFMYNMKTKENERTGFSKLKEGDSIHFVVSKTNPGNSTEKNRYDAVRILVIPQEFLTQ
jgi:hypothetical protein